MAYTETRTISYGSSLWGSIKGIGLGFTLLIAATALLWWNEGRAVHTAQDIQEIAETATHVDGADKLAPEGQLIHVNGTAVTTDTIEDALFGVRVNALSLSRKVEYFQVKETKKTETREKSNGSTEEITTYTYTKTWCDSPVNSSNFHDSYYRNSNRTIGNLSFKDEEKLPYQVAFGAYKMQKDFFGEIANCAGESTEPIDFNKLTLESIDDEIAKVEGSVANADPESYQWVQYNDNGLYFGKNPNAPALGDIRITFTVRNPKADISVVAVSKNGELADYYTNNKNNVHYIKAGTKSLDEMIQAAEDDNTAATWGFRIVGILMVFFGFWRMFEFLVTLVKVIPVLSTMVNWAVSLICGVLAFVYSLIIIVVAWVYFRTLLFGIILAAIFAAFIAWAVMKRNKAQAEKIAAV